MQTNSRRELLPAFAALLWGGTPAPPQAQAHTGAKELARQALTGPQSGMEAVLVEVNILPNVPSTVHRHSGFVLGYVLEGELRFAIDGAKPRVVPTGGTFFEPVGALHTVGNSAKPDAPVRFLAFLVVPKGSSVVVPV